MTTVCIAADYSAYTQGFVELPEGKDWKDVADWYVKWDTFHFVLEGEGEQWQEQSLNADGVNAIDWKRPDSVTVLAVKDDGHPDYDAEPLDESNG